MILLKIVPVSGVERYTMLTAWHDRHLLWCDPDVSWMQAMSGCRWWVYVSGEKVGQEQLEVELGTLGGHCLTS